MAKYSETKYFISYVNREDLTKQINQYCKEHEIEMQGISHFEMELAPQANEPIIPPTFTERSIAFDAPKLDRVLVFTAIIYYNKRGL
jgi:hypothetical protein